MIKRRDHREKRFTRFCLVDASIWSTITIISTSYPSSLLSPSSSSYKRIAVLILKVLSPDGGFPKGLADEALTDIFLQTFLPCFGFLTFSTQVDF